MAIVLKLIAFTPNAANVVAASAKLCYSPSGAADILEGLDSKKIESFLKMLNETGHMSPFEHVSYTFAIEGISRVATHQLVRHRLASYSQQSQRYVEMNVPSCIVPPSILENEYALEIFQKQVDFTWECYKKLVLLGIAKEDARFILPHGAESRIVVTMNARELHLFFSLRLCKRAQWEIREVARQMFMLVRKASPELFVTGGPSCIVNGTCEEAHPCGDPYSSLENMLSK
ncbi:MAG: FAD-dependent thymidylate synthase [Synergistaceae bacterium]|nr:FAD-dependent thymidylate synthase [Synergistaceae bacterium]